MSYITLEKYTERFSLPSLSGALWGPRYSYPSEQCFCASTVDGNRLYNNSGINYGRGTCHPIGHCGDCNLNNSGLCPQSGPNLGVPGV